MVLRHASRSMLGLRVFLGSAFFSMLFSAGVQAQEDSESLGKSQGTKYFRDIQQEVDEAVEGVLEEPAMLVRVEAKKKPARRVIAASESKITHEQIKSLPQGTEVSLSKLITATTPGVVGGALGQMFFRGNHANAQYQIDGVQLPDSPSSAFSQAFSPRNIDYIDVITGGFEAQYGWRLNAVVNMVTKEGGSDPEGELELNYGSYNATSPHLLYSGSTETGRLRYYLSLNYFRTDRGIDTPQPKSTQLQDQLQGGNEAIHDRACGNNEFLKLDWKADEKNQISLLFSNSHYFYQIPNYPSSFSPSDPYFSKPAYTDVFGNQGETHAHNGHTDVNTTFNYTPSNTNDAQKESNVFLQASWKNRGDDRQLFTFSPYYKYSEMAVTGDPRNDLYTSTTSMGTFPIQGSSPSSLSMNRFINSLGIQTDYTFHVQEDHRLKAGFQAQASRTTGKFAILGQDQDGHSFNDADNKPYTGYFAGVYVQDDYKMAEPWILNVGLRYDVTRFVYTDQSASDGMLQPRIGLNWFATQTTKFHVFYGKLFQPAGIENLRHSFNMATGTSGTYDIKSEKSDFYEIGVAQKFAKDQVAQINLYYKNAKNMLDEAQLLNTSISQTYNLAEGYAYGGEVSIKGTLGSHWLNFLNYSYSIARGKGISGGAWAVDPDEDSPTYRMLDHLQIHTLNAGLTYFRGPFWWTTQGLYGSGLRTGIQNSKNLPGHFTMDSTLGYEFTGESFMSRFRVSMDALNIFDKRYPITIANAFNGSHYAAGRQFFVRLTKFF